MRMTRNRGWLCAIAVIASLLLPTIHKLLAQEAAQTVAAESVDLLFAGGEMVDGSGAPALRADVGIRGDRIVFVGDAAAAKIHAARTIDASGLIVSPGFIDPHTHTGGDLANPKTAANLPYLMQGVTTVVFGNDGASPWPIADALARMDRQGIGTNAAILVGHGTVRGKVLGMADVAPTSAQLEQMKALVSQAMDEGAFGLSTGLYYVPGNYSKTEEVIELSKVAAAKGGIYDTHMRDEDSTSIGVLGSIEETIRIGREAKIPVHISHIKMLGPEVWGKSVQAIAMIRKARAEGVDVTANQYPYTASGTSLVACLVPQWAQEGGDAAMLARLKDLSLRERLSAEMARNLEHRGGAESLLFTSSEAPDLLGKTLAAVAKERKLEPVATAMALVTESAERKALGRMAVASFNMSEDDIDRLMVQDWVMTGSDGSPGHPRKYGTFPRKLRLYVYEKKLLKLEDAVHKSSRLTAETFRIPDRGLLRTGYFADVIVFDPKTIADESTYEKPEVLATGVKYVIVNGRLVIEDGRFNGTLAGRALRKPSH